MSFAVKFRKREVMADLEGLTVSELRERYEGRWEIPPEAIAIVNSKEADEDRVL